MEAGSVIRSVSSARSCAGAVQVRASVADASEIWNHRKRRVIRPLDDIADLFDDLAPVLFKVCVADGGIVGRRDTDDDHRLFAAGKFNDLLDIANAWILQRQLTLLDRGPQDLSTLGLHLANPSSLAAARASSSEEKHARRSVQLFRFR